MFAPLASILAVLSAPTALSQTSTPMLESGFIENVGQFDPDVRFVRRTASGPVFVTLDRLAFRIGTGDRDQASTAVHLVFEGGAARSIRASDPDSTVHNYLIGRNPSGWHTGVRAFGRVTLEDVWPGIDVVLTTNATGIEYDFVLAPGADPNQIRVRCDGTTELEIDALGVTQLTTPCGSLAISKPATFVIDSVGSRHEVASRHRKLDSHLLGFDVGDTVRGSGERMVIDPKIDFTTFMGGSDYDVGSAAQFDASGAIYQVGETLSLDFPSAAGLQPALAGSFDGFVVKLLPNGTAAQWVTYFGGSGDDLLRDVDCFESGSGSLATIAGFTTSSDLPLSANPADATLSGPDDVFVARLSADGTQLVYSTYLGGTAGEGSDFVGSLQPDFSTPSLRCLPNGATWVAGRSASSDFPLTAGAIDTTVDSLAGGDGFFTRLSASGSTIEYSSYLGGSGYDFISDLEISTNGDCLVTGTTSSTDLPTTPAAWLPSFPAGMFVSAFAARIQTAPSTISALTYLKTTLPELSANAIAENGSHHVLIGGNAVDPFSGGFENLGTASILRLDPNLTLLEALGTYGAGALTDLAIDSLDRTFAAANLKVGTQFQSLALRVDEELMLVTSTLGLLKGFSGASSIAIGPGQRFALALNNPMQSPLPVGTFDTVAVEGDGALVVGDLECAGSFTTTAAGCAGSIGSTPVLHGAGCLTSGSQFTLRISQASATNAFLFVGLGTTALPLTPNCSLAIGPLTGAIFTLPIVPSALPQLGGVSIVTSGVPPLAAPIDVWMQAIVVNPALAQPTFAVTNALKLHASP